MSIHHERGQKASSKEIVSGLIFCTTHQKRESIKVLYRAGTQEN